MRNNIEVRTGMPAEIRADGNGPIKVSGHAAVFSQPADIGGVFLEQIAPGAFTEAIGRDDVVFLINHQGLPLARTRSGTLKLSEDSTGLYIETGLDPNDPDVMTIVPKLKRGDLDKMSFAFLPELQEWDETGDMPVRTILKAQLIDVSVVTHPVYEGTDIAMRHLQDYRHQRRFERQIQVRRVRLALSA